MKKIMTVHYVPKPGGGVAEPGEILEPAVAAKFTDAQIARLLKIGAILVEDVYEPENAAGTPQGDPETPQGDPETPQADAETEPEEEEEDNEPEPEPPEIDAMDGIVQADEAPEEPQKKPRAGRRKAK